MFEAEFIILSLRYNYVDVHWNKNQNKDGGILLYGNFCLNFTLYFLDFYISVSQT